MESEKLSKGVLSVVQVENFPCELVKSVLVVVVWLWAVRVVLLLKVLFCVVDQ